MQSLVWANDFALAKTMFKIVHQRHKMKPAVVSKSITTAFAISINLRRKNQHCTDAWSNKKCLSWLDFDILSGAERFFPVIYLKEFR